MMKAAKGEWYKLPMIGDFALAAVAVGLVFHRSNDRFWASLEDLSSPAGGEDGFFGF